MKQSKWTCSQD